MKIKSNLANDRDAARGPRRVEGGDGGNTARDSAAIVNVGGGVKSLSPSATLNVYASAAKIEEMMSTIKNMPAVRAERVETLRTRIALGEFNPSAAMIADRILTSLY